MNSTFVELKQDVVATLRAKDPAINALQKLRQTGKPLSFSWLRAMIGKDRDMWSQLGRGTAILDSPEQLDQYLYSYGPMIACQWESLLDGVTLSPKPVRFVDYGCGQGLAGVLLFDKFGDAFASKLASIVLVEPSSVALVRAEAVYRTIARHADITCVNKGFDAASTNDLKSDASVDTIHFFSNVLDVDGFNQYRLFGEVLTKGKHTVLAVSPDRDFDGGTPRILALKSAVEDPEHAPTLSVNGSEFKQFGCGPGGKYPAVSWHVKLEVSHG